MSNGQGQKARANLATQFVSLFTGHAARAALAKLGSHTKLPTFNLSTTSLRHTNMWFDRLHEINQGLTRAHGNYFSDPASIGLVDRSTARPRVLTQAGQAYLTFRNSLRNNPLRGEYELLKILYFSAYQNPDIVEQHLAEKRDHLFSALAQFTPTPSRQVFLVHPRLLVVAELISGFPGAIGRLIRLPEADLLALDSLGEKGFTDLCDGPGFPTRVSRLCRRIGSDYTRGEERRLHYLVSMALLTIAQGLPVGRATTLTVPLPFANLLTEIDIYNLHAQYTSDINVWFDGVNFRVSSSLGVLPAAPPHVPVLLQLVTLEPQRETPGGTGSAPTTDPSRRRRRAAKRTEVTVVIDTVISERAEDVAEELILRPRHGVQLERVGHRAGETIALPDGMVPGADFYVLDATNKPIEFIEIKSVTGAPPFEISLTRAEYLRALRCAQAGLPYRLVLVDVSSAIFYEISQFASSLASLQLSEAIRFVIKVGPTP
ncbi:MAG: hypothetical protein ACLQJF_16155 [Candidatus Sulfotelmatobacter sp.]